MCVLLTRMLLSTLVCVALVRAVARILLNLPVNRPGDRCSRFVTLASVCLMRS